jgi:carbonic anhydrase
MKTLMKEMQTAITPSMALNLLKEVKKRFVNNLKVNRYLLQQGAMKPPTVNIRLQLS